MEGILKMLRRKEKPQPYHQLAATDLKHGNFIVGVLKENIEAMGGWFGYQRDILGDDWERKHVSLRIGQLDARFQLQQLPGCCAMMTLSYVNVLPETPENFKTVAELVALAAKESQFALVMMTQVYYLDRRIDQELWHLCLSHGWEMSDHYFNPKSGNWVVTLIRDFDQTKKVGT